MSAKSEPLGCSGFGIRLEIIWIGHIAAPPLEGGYLLPAEVATIGKAQNRLALQSRS